MTHTSANGFQVPYTLESLISYGIFVCLDSLLFVFTALPIRAAIALYHLLLRGRKLHALQKVDVLKTISLVLGYLFLRLIDIPRSGGDDACPLVLFRLTCGMHAWRGLWCAAFLSSWSRNRF